MSDELSFTNDGVSFVNGIMSQNDVKILNDELDFLFSKKSKNGALGAITVSPTTTSLMMPTLSVRSLNLLELSLSVKDELGKCNEIYHSYVNTLIEIIQESKQPPLNFHTDNRKGMIRAMIYIDVDKDKSGMLRYIKGTQNRDFFVKHHLTTQQVEDYSQDVVNCDVPVGTLILFDSFGFHGREKCLGKRRCILFEFQPKNSTFAKSAVPLSSRNLTANVVKNLPVFLNDASEYNHGGDYYYRNPPLTNIILRIIRKLMRILNK